MSHVGYAIHLEENMKAVIDRMEGKIAVLLMGEDGSAKVNMPMALLPAECKEGDILEVSITKDEKATVDAKDRSKRLIEKLKQKGQDRSGIVQD
jgi:hypothetical protein